MNRIYKFLYQDIDYIAMRTLDDFAPQGGPICGVDEAGRGPVLGPIIVAGVMVEDDAQLKKLGVKDSKKLTPARRFELVDQVSCGSQCRGH